MCFTWQNGCPGANNMYFTFKKWAEFFVESRGWRTRRGSRNPKVANYQHSRFTRCAPCQAGAADYYYQRRYATHRRPSQSQPRAELSHAFCPAGGRTRAGGYGPPPYRSREKSRRGSTSSGNLGRRWPSLGLCPPSAWALCGSCSPWRVVVPSSQVSCYMQASTEKRERKDNSHSDALVFGSHTPGG